MHHGTCVPCRKTYRDCLPAVAGKNVPGIPGACATRKFRYLVRGPWFLMFYYWYNLQLPLMAAHAILEFCSLYRGPQSKRLLHTSYSCLAYVDNTSVVWPVRVLLILYCWFNSLFLLKTTMASKLHFLPFSLEWFSNRFQSMTPSHIAKNP